MKKIALLLSLFSILLSANAFGQDENKKPDTDQEQTEKQPDNVKDDAKNPDEGQPFEDVRDRTLKLNQETTDSKIFTPDSPFAQQAFVPDISLILDSSYVYRDVNNNTYGGLKTPSFTSGIKDFEKNGFNLNYAEMAIASTVDPFLDLLAVIPFTPEGVGIEEAFINSRSLPFNFQLKVGKFRSSWGRLNSMHEHVWDFADPPLVYTALFGTEQLNDTGIQVNWLAPLDTYLLLGAEVLQGNSENSFGTTGFTLGKNNIAEINRPNLVLGFAKTSIDLDNFTLLGGLSYARGGTRESNTVDDPKNSTGFDGTTSIYGGDLTLKYFLSSYTYLTLQSEFMYRNTLGNNYDAANNIMSVSKNQSGLYSQLTWRFTELWRTALRYDLMLQNDVLQNNANINSPGNLARYSAMIEYNPTEFSRIRLQYNHDRSKYGDNIQPVNEIFLQLNMAIGSHGAHAF